jgi:hypothetical protein
MTINFEALKNNRKSQFDKLTSELNKLNQGTTQESNGDDRLWKPDVDKAGNGYAVIRFLPAPTGEDVPFVRIWDHGFQGPGGWYIERSLTTLNKPDPVSEYNGKLWNSGIESNKDLVRKQKRRLSYYSNIYVVSDPSRPDNEGKIFLFKYGKKIFDKLNEAMHPQFPGEAAVNPFDMWEGANFKLKIRQVDGYRNYDKSEFDKPEALADDSKLESVWKQCHSLQELLDLKHFKSYEELKFRLDKALGNVAASTSKSYDEDDMPTAAAPQQRAVAAKEAPKATSSWDDDDEDRFEKLREMSGHLPIPGTRENEPGEEFDFGGFLSLHMLNQVMQIRAENEQFIPFPSYGLDNVKSVIDLKSLAFGPTVDTWQQLGTDMVDIFSGSDRQFYKRRTGPYEWQDKGGRKVFAHLAKMVGINASNIAPAQMITNTQKAKDLSTKK